MELIRGLHNIRPRHHGCVATIGAFDGLHYGHQAVLQHLLKKAKELNVPSTVVTLEPLPREYFAPTKAPARIMSFREKFEGLRAMGVDRVLRVPFNEKTSRIPARDFIQDVFVKGLGIRYIITGDDLRFGHEQEGDFALLREEGAKSNFQVESTQTLTIAGERVSSTRLRQALENADFTLAEQLLGRPYSISGRVIVGKQLGRTLNTPTANVQLHRIRAAMSGVYAVQVCGVADKPVWGVANVGVRPTLDDGLQKAILEVHLIDFEKDIYGEHIHVFFRKKIREEKKFLSLDELKQNIAADIKITQQLTHTLAKINCYAPYQINENSTNDRL